MIGLRRVLWGIFPVDLSAEWEHYWTSTSMCALAGLLVSEILYWRWGIHTHIHTYIKMTWYSVCEWVNFPSAAWLCAVHVSCCSVDVCVYEKADLVIRWLQCSRFATNQDQQVWTQNLFWGPRVPDRGSTTEPSPPNFNPLLWLQIPSLYLQWR
jgi:hypothetical protein